MFATYPALKRWATVKRPADAATSSPPRAANLCVFAVNSCFGWHNLRMRLWLARGSEIPIREQVVTQVVLGILSDELPPGARLPSTRELARRFRVHANTVSAAYRELE